MGLLDEEEMYRVNAFDWDGPGGFPKIMNAGGFDAVIGNPPYVRIGNIDETIRPYLFETYDVNHRFDIYVAFIQRVFNLLAKQGRFGFIVPNKFFTAEYGSGLRAYLTDNDALGEIVDFGDTQVFRGATTYTCLLFLNKSLKKFIDYRPARAEQGGMSFGGSPTVNIESRRLGREPWVFISEKAIMLSDRMKEFPQLGTYCMIARGLETGADDFFLLSLVGTPAAGHALVKSKLEQEPFLIEREIIQPVVKGAIDVRRYLIESNERFLFFPYFHDNEGKPRLFEEKDVRDQYPLAWQYLKRYETVLRKKKGDNWFAFRRRNYDLQSKIPKLLVPSIAKRASFGSDKDGRYQFIGSGGGGGGGYGISIHSESQMSILYLLGILNIRLLDWNVKLINSRFGQGYYSFNRQYIEPLPIRPIDFSNPIEKSRHDQILELVERMLDLNRRLQESKTAHEKDSLQRQIDATDRQIDRLVYELYELTEDEIKIVEEQSA